MKKIFPVVLGLAAFLSDSVSGQRNNTLREMICGSSYILVVERLDPPVTTKNYNCLVGLLHHRAYHETIHHFRVLEVLRGNRVALKAMLKDSRIDVHKAYTYFWWKLQKENKKIHGTLIEQRYSRGSQKPFDGKHMVFLQTWGERFEFLIHDACESFEKRDEVVRLIEMKDDCF